jgi:hypothetical protein
LSYLPNNLGDQNDMSSSPSAYVPAQRTYKHKKLVHPLIFINRNK